MRCLLGVAFVVSVFALRGIAQNSDQLEKPSQSPDGKWEYRLLDLEDDQSDITPAIVKTDTDDVAVKLPIAEEKEIVWAPDPKSLPLYYPARGRFFLNTV